MPGQRRPALGRELVRCATLAPSSHNTQCWKAALLRRVGSADAVDLLLLTEPQSMERTLDSVIQGNAAQFEDATFVSGAEDLNPLQWQRLIQAGRRNRAP